MNKKTFLLAIILLITGQLVTAQESQLITLSADGAETQYALSSVQKIIFENETMTVNMTEGDDAMGIMRISFVLANPYENVDYSQLKINEVSGVGDDCEKFYELINLGEDDIPLEGCKLYYNANESVGLPLPTGDGNLTWTGNETQIAEAGQLFCLIGRNGGNCSDPPTQGSFTTGLTPERKLIITLKDPNGNVIDQFIRAEDTEMYAMGRYKSFSRIPDGTGNFYFTDPTPCVLNGDDATGLLLVPQTPDGTGIIKPKATTPVLVFPNPVKNILTVSGTDKVVKINLFDLNGMLLKSTMSQGNKTNIDVSSLQQGTYLLHIDGQVVKFIKQ